MTTSAANQLESLLRGADLDWIIGLYAPPDRAVSALLDTLAAVDREAAGKLGTDAPRFTVEALAHESKLNPHKVRAFLQALTATRSPAMLLMAWRIIQGMRIQQVEMKYTYRDRFFMTVFLESPYGDGLERYESSDIKDASLLRHFGIMSVDGKPVFDGFYPLRLS